MPRKLLKDAYRGWWGWEGRVNSVTRMSNYTLWECQLRMEQERWRHEAVMKRIRATEKIQLNCAKKTFNTVHEDYVRILAERHVYQQHAFRNYDPELGSTSEESQADRKRPLTERAPQAVSVDERGSRRNSLPAIRKPEEKARSKLRNRNKRESSSTKPERQKPKRVSTNTKVAETAKHGSTKPVHPKSKDSGDKSVSQKSGSLDRLNLSEQKKLGEGRIDTDDGAFFLTQSDVLSSTLAEDDEDVFIGETENSTGKQTENTQNTDSQSQQKSDDTFKDSSPAVTGAESSDSAPVTASEESKGEERSSLRKDQETSVDSERKTPANQEKDTDADLRPETREGKGPTEDSFQNIDFMLEKTDRPVATPERRKAVRFSVTDQTQKTPNTSSDLPHTSAVDSEGRLSSEGNNGNSYFTSPDDTKKTSASKERVGKESRGSLTAARRRISVVRRSPSNKISGSVSPANEKKEATTVETTSTTTEGKQNASGKLNVGRSGSSFDVSGQEYSQQTDRQNTISNENQESNNSTSLGQMEHEKAEDASCDDGSPKETPHLSSDVEGPVGDSSYPTSVPDKPDGSQPSQTVPNSEAPQKAKLALTGLTRFRQAAETIVTEKRIERELAGSVLTALLLNRPQKQPRRLREVEKPQAVREKEESDTWRELLLNMQAAVRWRARVIRQSQGVINTRQVRRLFHQREQEQPRTRTRHVFPGACKTTWAMKKFLSREIDSEIEAMRPENKRRHRNHQLMEQSRLPEFVDRVRSTTAILREFRKYKNRGETEGGSGEEKMGEDSGETEKLSDLKRDSIRSTGLLPLPVE